MTPHAHTRVLALLPTQRDAELSHDMLARNGIGLTVCASGGDLAAQLREGVGVVLVAEEMLGPQTANAAHALEDYLRTQPRWSDLPVLVLTHSGANSDVVLDAIARLGNVALLERPLRVAALLSSVRAALRARQRQYQLREHLDALERARLEEVEEARRKDEFLAMLGHELRNPLAPIRNALNALSIDDSDPARRRRLRSMMLRQVNHLIRLVDDLLEVSRMTRGKVSLRRESLDLRGPIRDAINLATPLLEAGPQTLHAVLPDHPVLIDGDHVRLTQVFGNLINNAAKYGHPGGHIHVGMVVQDAHAEVFVRDDGQGIEAAMLQRIFEPFAQGNRVDADLQEGLGIGLALVRSLVDLHGGAVTVSSEGPGRGSEFRVFLPRLQGTPAPAPEEPALVPGDPPPGLRVLVVDDNVDAAQSLSMLLDILGIDNRTAHGGEAALEAARWFLPDVALLDIGMPGMDGCEVARHLRADPRHRDVLLVALTGWNNPTDRQRTQAAGFDHHMSKPVDAMALRDLLRQYTPQRNAPHAA